MADIIDFSQWEQVLSAAKDLVKATHFLFQIVDDPKGIDPEVYALIIRMHNSAVDYIVSVESKEDKED